MPCTEKRARLFLGRSRARAHRLVPFTLRLVDRLDEESIVDGLQLKIDPGSRHAGMALAGKD